MPQASETQIKWIKGSRLAYRYAYARSADTQAAGEPGQDYLTYHEVGDKLLFALCDGVSQSFYGDIAARILGDALLTWLFEATPTSGDANSVSSSLTRYLTDLTKAATEAVQRQTVPENIPPMLREVLEQKREHGSESTFVCGRIDLPTPQVPEGRVVCAWLGDSRLRIWGPAGERTAEFGDTFRTEQRWSSKQGPVGGQPNLFVSPVVHAGRYVIERLLAYSDGLSTLDGQNSALSNFALQDMISEAGEGATSDDISLLEVWLGRAPSHIDAAPLAAPGHVKVSHEVSQEADQMGETIRVSWREVRGAQRYEVDLSDSERQRWDADTTSWISPSLSTGHYSVRVRAWNHTGPGKWSPNQEVVIPEPTRESGTPDSQTGTSYPEINGIQKDVAATSGSLAEITATGAPSTPGIPGASRVPVAPIMYSSTSVHPIGEHNAGSTAARGISPQRGGSTAYVGTTARRSWRRLGQREALVILALFAALLVLLVLTGWEMNQVRARGEAQAQASVTAHAVQVTGTMQARSSATALAVQATSTAEALRITAAKAFSATQQAEATGTSQALATAQEQLATTALAIQLQSTVEAQAQALASVQAQVTETAQAEGTTTAVTAQALATRQALEAKAEAEAEAEATVTSRAAQLATIESRATSTARALNATTTAQATNAPPTFEATVEVTGEATETTVSATEQAERNGESAGQLTATAGAVQATVAGDATATALARSPTQVPTASVETTPVPTLTVQPTVVDTPAPTATLHTDN